MLTAATLQRDLRRLASAVRAKTSAWFFKTADGQYGAGDVFLGVTVPQQREVAKKFRDLSLSEVLKLLKSPYHEHRLTAVLILDDQFQRADETRRARIARAYLGSTKYVNNWDIVDSSAPQILGTYLLDKPRAVLYRLARSNNLWERRISILATQTFIRHGQFNDTLKLAKLLLQDKEDLMHKAVGWMLREVGDRDRKLEERFLNRHAGRMPRTMLRYAIEKFPSVLKKRYMAL